MHETLGHGHEKHRFLRSRLVPPPTLAGLHRDLPVHLLVPVLLALAYTLIAGVAPHLLLASVQQCVRRHHVRHVPRRRLHAAGQTRVRVHTDMRLQPVVPLVALVQVVLEFRETRRVYRSHTMQ